MKTLVFAFLCACGGATAAPRHDDIAVTTSPVAASPPLFTGAFEVESMTDGKQTVVVADMLRKYKVHEGRMTYEIGNDKFRIGMWTISEPEKLSEADDPNTTFAEFCRTYADVTSHWEGSTLVLSSTIATEGSGGVVRVFKKTQGASTTRNQSTATGNCSASFAATRIAFEIVEKDESGPTRVRGTAPGVTLNLVRGRAIASIEPAKLLEK